MVLSHLGDHRTLGTMKWRGTMEKPRVPGNLKKQSCDSSPRPNPTANRKSAKTASACQCSPLFQAHTQKETDRSFYSKITLKWFKKSMRDSTHANNKAGGENDNNWWVSGKESLNKLYQQEVLKWKRKVGWWWREAKWHWIFTSLHSCGSKTGKSSLLGSTFQPSLNIILSELFHACPQQDQRRKSHNPVVEFPASFMNVIAGQNGDNFNCFKNIVNHAFSS